MIGENDIDADFKQTNGIDEPEQNHINLSVSRTSFCVKWPVL